MGVYTTSVQVALAGLMRRVLYKYVKDDNAYLPRVVPSTELVTERLGDFFHRLKCVVDVNVMRCRWDDYPNFYSGGKRKSYMRAVATLLRSPYSRVRDALVKAFVKVEPTQPGKDPRLIQTRSIRYHVLLGSFVRPAEKLIYRAVDKLFGGRTIVKGLNAGQVGALIAEKWHSFRDTVAIGLDASRFDRSVSEPLLVLVHSILLHMYNYDPELAMYLQHQTQNRGIIGCDDGFISYKVDGGIMSGDVDTSLKGCVIMCALVWSWARSAGVRLQLVDNGDDCVAFMERGDMARFIDGMSGWFAQLGVDIVAEEPVYELEKVVFCQTQPVLGSGGTYVMCRNPITASVKDSMTTVNLSVSAEYKRWMSSVAACGTALAGDMPIFCEIYAAYGRFAGYELHERTMTGGLKWLSDGMKARHGVTELTRYSFWRAFEIPPFVQREVEAYYQQLSLGTGLADPKEISFPERFRVPESIIDISSSW
uniref:RNA-directed RNA polymerase n=1 Tax=Grapevine-associated RNA virus 10 TaxID=2814385 RepID=A0A8F5MLE6_9VIRU|nr:MAG: RNA-dependent RNA polymerase [Grapevine-associated RNA virus 10]